MANEIEKREISLESASIHLKSLNNDLSKFQDWFTQTQAKFATLKKAYKEAQVHDLASLQRFEQEAKTLEIIVFSHQEDLPALNQHYKNYASTTDYFSKDLKNFCVKLKNNRIKRLSIDMTSDLSSLKDTIVEAEKTQLALYQELITFKAKLIDRIEANIQFDNSCMKLDLWLNEFEPKINNEILKSTKLINDSNNNEGKF